MPFYVISNHTCNLKLRAYIGKFSLDFAVHKLYVICDFALFGLSQCVVKLVLKSCLSSYKRFMEINFRMMFVNMNLFPRLTTLHLYG